MVDEKQFIEAFNELEIKSGISKDAILNALKEALDKGLKKQLGGDDAYTEVKIDSENGKISLSQLKKVVAGEEEDDFLEINLEDARKKYPDIQVGDFYRIDYKLDDILKTYALVVKNVFKQKLNEAEKVALYEAYKDKIGEMITGVVDKVEERGLQVTIAKTSIFVPRRELIGDEKFYPKDAIKLYVSGVKEDTKGTKISVSRSNEGYLKRVFEEEIHEIYDGTIIIKTIARKAGQRSKVAVYSNDINVDPAGACIGPNGARIQKVVAQLGNSSNKEKVDVIEYCNDDALFVMESLKPAVVVGIDINKENKTATVIIADGNSNVAFGKKMVNKELSERLTGYKLTLIEESEAKEKQISYQSYEEVERAFTDAKQKAVEELLAKQEKENHEKILHNTQGYVAPNQRHYDDTISEEEKEILEEVVDKEELTTVEEEKEHSTLNEELSTSEETKDVVKQEENELEDEKTAVKTTTTLADLEKELALESQKAKSNQSKGKKKSKKEEENSENVVVNKVDPSQRMSIYTDEELKAFEEEEGNELNQDYEDDDFDYDDYDDYYDDEGK